LEESPGDWKADKCGAVEIRCEFERVKYPEYVEAMAAYINLETVYGPIDP
jgi:hypothetical protein